MNKLNIKIKKIYEDAHLPTRGSEEAAGWDLYAYIPSEEASSTSDPSEAIYIIRPHVTKKINTGLAMAIPKGWEGEIRPRSGIATNRSLRVQNTPGTIDSDYRGQIQVALHNDSNDEQIVHNGERIAQILFHEVPEVEWLEVEDLDQTERGTGGFGSTGRI